MKTHGGTLNAYYQLKEANLKGDILYDPNHMIFYRQTMETVKRSVVAKSLGDRGLSMWNARDI